MSVINHIGAADIVSEIEPCLVRLKPSNNPIYRIICFPHGGGSAQAFEDWAAHVPDGVELVAVQAPGRAKRFSEPNLDNMDDLVDLILLELETLNDCPLVFFGHSAGALVAFETTRRLEDEGNGIAPFHLVLSAHKAAHIPPDEPLMHLYSDEALGSLVGDLGLVPGEALADSEFLAEILLPPVRADFKLAETYDCSLARPLNAAITAMGGNRDPLLGATDLWEWQSLTNSRFDVVMFEGNHFYTQSQCKNVLDAIQSSTQEVEKALPRAITFGETAPYPKNPLHVLLRRQASQTPNAPALISPDETFSFAELDHWSDALALQLTERGVTKGSAVGVLFETSPQYVVAIFAALKAGGAYCVIDPTLPKRAIEKLVEHAQMSALLTSTQLSQKIPHSLAEQTFILGNGKEELPHVVAVDTSQLPIIGIDDPAQIVFSSGTTGKPKGIVCPHRSALSSYQWRYDHLPYEEDEREAFNIFLVWEVMRPLLLGRVAYLIPDTVIYDPYQLADYLIEHKITRVLLTPSLLSQFLSSKSLEVHRLQKTLRIAYLNGEVVSDALLERARMMLPQVRFINDYSIAETHDVSHCEVGNVSSHIARTVVPVGPPQSNVSIYILNDDLSPAAVGFRGEIYVGGDAVGLGYLNAPELTTERFLEDPFIEGGRMFRTGDGGRLQHNGHLEIQGRKAFMIKLRGYSIVPDAIAATIEAQDAVEACAVLPEMDPETGQPERIVAYVVLSHVVSDWKGQLLQCLAEELPSYAIPATFVPVPNLPLKENGKLDREQLINTRQVDRAMPKTAVTEHPLREVLVQLWKEMLSVDDVHAGSHFFEEGGHSLLAAELVSHVRGKLGLSLTVAEVFMNPTFESLLRSCTALEARQALKSKAAPAPHSAPRAPAAPVKAVRPHTKDVAIIGMAARLPGAETIEQYWSNLCNGLSAIRKLDEDTLKASRVPTEVLQDPAYVPFGAHVDNVAAFDPTFWGLSEREATLMDPQHRLFLESCWQALEMAGYPSKGAVQDIGVYAGCFLPLYLLHHLTPQELLFGPDVAIASLTELGNDKDYLASRASFLLNLSGPSVAVQTSCSTGLVAIAMAAQAVAEGKCKMALAGASSLIFPQAGYYYAEGFVNASDGACNAFDADANGTVLGDGVGVVLLKRLGDALRDGDHIHAVIKGSAINNDGQQKASFSAPSVTGQADVIRSALDVADLFPEDVSYIETHGTGTKVGDPIELGALAKVFGDGANGRSRCAVGSVKPNIGHANIAAGVASFIKTVLCLEHKRIPPTIGINRLNPDLRIDETPFFVNQRLRSWPEVDGKLRTAGVTSLGIGGTNCHIVLQEHKTADDSWRGAISEGSYALCLSAKSSAALSRACLALADFLSRNPDSELKDVAYTLRVSRAAFDHRLVVVAGTISSAITKLREAALDSNTPVLKSPKVALMLPGGGTHHLGMVRELAQAVPAFCGRLDHIAELALPLLGYDFRPTLFSDGVEHTADFDCINLMMFAVQYAAAELLQDCGVQPDLYIGHSMSEYVAACLAGGFALEDALHLMAVRSHAMQSVDVDGIMLAARCGLTTAETLLAEPHWASASAAGDVAIGVINSAQSTVFTGRREKLELLEAELCYKGIRSQMLDTGGVPSHSSLMAPAGDIIDQTAQTLCPKQLHIPVALNVAGTLQPAGTRISPQYWRNQATHEIRFDLSVATALNEGMDVFVDLGPSQNLGRLVEDALHPEQDHILLTAAMRCRHDEETSDRAAILHCLGQLWASGVAIDWPAAEALFEPKGQGRHVLLPTYSFEKQVCWPKEDTPPRDRKPDNYADDQRTYFYTEGWSQSLQAKRITNPRSVDDRPVLAFVDQRGADCPTLGEAVAAALEAQGRCVQRIYRDTSQIDKTSLPENALFWENTTETLHEQLPELLEAGNAIQLLYFWHLDAAGLSDPDLSQVDMMKLETLNQVFALSRVIALHAIRVPVDLWLITNNSVQICDEPFSAEKMGVFGPLIVLAQENPSVTCRLIDAQTIVPVQDQTVRQIYQEVSTVAPCRNFAIAFRGKHRWVLDYPEISLCDAAAANTALRSDGVYLVTGGLGRIGRALASHLTGLGAQVVVTTRRDVPPKTQWKDLCKEPGNTWMTDFLEAETSGGEIRVVTLQSQDTAALRQVLLEMTQDQTRVTGIFHAAGLADLHFLSETDSQVLNRELEPKAHGSCALYNALAQIADATSITPDFVFLFSSLASILGGPAMASYAAANRFLDGFARQAWGQLGVRWINTNWDDWDFAYDGQVTSAYDTSLARKLALSPDEGIDLIRRILASVENGQVIVAARPLKPRIREWLDQDHEKPAHAAQAQSSDIPEISVDGCVPNRPPLETFLSEVAAVLGRESVTESDNFFDLGGDSLLVSALQIRLRQNRQWKPPQLKQIFKSPTLAALFETLNAP